MTIQEYLASLRGKTVAVIGVGVSNRPLIRLLREAGIAYAIDQISDLVAAGVDGIHLYTMNNPAVARQISDSVSAIRRV